MSWHCLLPAGKLSESRVSLFCLTSWCPADIVSQRPLIRAVLASGTKSASTEEITARAKYYLSQVLRLRSPPLPDEANRLSSEADLLLQRLLPLAPPSLFNVEPYDDSILYDYLVAAQFRVFTFRAKQMRSPISPQLKSIKSDQLLRHPSSSASIAARSVSDLRPRPMLLAA